jgi:sterol desaturase/sphingolipid hydroxylase (fatty acid hydroxylase superfamily)
VGYLSHRSLHMSSLLWRFHRIHHCDDLVDVTTTYRTHPIETSSSERAHTIVYGFDDADAVQLSSFPALLTQAFTSANQVSVPDTNVRNRTAVAR